MRLIFISTVPDSIIFCDLCVLCRPVLLRVAVLVKSQDGVTAGAMALVLASLLHEVAEKGYGLKVFWFAQGETIFLSDPLGAVFVSLRGEFSPSGQEVFGHVFFNSFLKRFLKTSQIGSSQISG